MCAAPPRPEKSPRCPLCSPLTPEELAAWEAGTSPLPPMAACLLPEHVAALTPPAVGRMPMPKG
jgi:hypothetical protein